MKFLVDMNLSPVWVPFLRESGWDAMHWSTTGKPTASDSEIFSFAFAHGYVVLTHDLDFGAVLAASHQAKPSVVQIRADNVSPNAIGTRVISALQFAQEHLERGALLTIEPDRARLRLLPLAGEQ